MDGVLIFAVICAVFGFNYCFSRNRDRKKFYACVAKGLIILKGVVNSETRNVLIIGFYRWGL